MTETTVTADRLREMLAGCEGVTPGPWDVMRQNLRASDRSGHWSVPLQVGKQPNGGNTFAEVYMGGPATTHNSASEVSALAEHLARCDPNTMRQIITLALEALALRTPVEGEGTAEKDRVEHLVEALRDLTEATRNSCNAAQHPPLTDALFVADMLLAEPLASPQKPVAEAVGVDWSKALNIAEAYIGEYEFDDGEQVFYSPSENERLVMIDMINGLLSDDNFIASITATTHPDEGLGVEVKPLTWEKHNVDGTVWTSEVSVTGEYHVNFTGSAWAASVRMLSLGKDFPDSNSAKRASDAHHAQCILSSLQPKE